MIDLSKFMRLHTKRYLMTIFFMLLISGRQIYAQTEKNKEDFSYSFIIEEIMENIEEEEKTGHFLDDLNELSTNPININKATIDDLKKIFFLNDFQVNSIIQYRNDFGNFLSINELLLVPGFQSDLLKKIQPFIYVLTVEDQKLKNSTKRSITYNHIIRFKYKPETPAGFSIKTDSLKRFQGNNHYLLSRKEVSINKNIKAGLLSEKDPGEPYLSLCNTNLPDHYSGYLEIQNIKKLKKIIIGDFRTNFGQGLICGSSFISKNANAIIPPDRDIIKKSLSATESGYNRGVGTVIKSGRFSFYNFISLVTCDAKINYTERNSDSITYFSSINTTGLHRNTNECQNSNSLKIFNAGINLVYNLRNATIGFTAVKTKFSHPKEISVYDTKSVPAEYILHFINRGMHYRINLGKAIFFGEIASDYSNNLAFINGLLAQLHPLFTISVIQRYYSPEYISFSSGSFGKSSETRNEEGLYIGLNFYPFSFFNLSCYADHYSFPWLRHNISSPDQGNDYYLNGLLNFNSKNNVVIRYNISLQSVKKERAGTGIDLTGKSKRNSLRISYNYEINRDLQFETRFDCTGYSEDNTNYTQGYYLGQKVIFRPERKKIGLWCSYGLFDIPEWKNRIYIYENDVLYDFSVPALYRTGSRFSAMIKSTLFCNIDFWIKYYVSYYGKITERGAGVDLIKSNTDSGIKLQIRIKI